MKHQEDFCDIPTLFINLSHRTDRRTHVETEMKKIQMKHVFRFEACHIPSNGALGCSLSHLKCLELAKQRNWEKVFICEDDICFLNPELIWTQTQTFLNSEREWDVLLIGGNIQKPVPPVEEDNTCIKVIRCQTTTGYVVQRHYYDVLIENIREGAKKLAVYPRERYKYAIDIYWFSLQQLHNWYFIHPFTVTQLPGFSDIENRFTNYNSVMLV